MVVDTNAGTYFSCIPHSHIIILQQVSEFLSGVNVEWLRWQFCHMIKLLKGPLEEPQDNLNMWNMERVSKYCILGQFFYQQFFSVDIQQFIDQLSAEGLLFCALSITHQLENNLDLGLRTMWEDLCGSLLPMAKRIFQENHLWRYIPQLIDVSFKINFNSTAINQEASTVSILTELLSDFDSRLNKYDTKIKGTTIEKFISKGGVFIILDASVVLTALQRNQLRIPKSLHSIGPTIKIVINSLCKIITPKIPARDAIFSEASSTTRIILTPIGTLPPPRPPMTKPSASRRRMIIN